MSQYKTGTVAVNNGSAIVTGTGTAWIANLTAGQNFKVSGLSPVYQIGSVDSDTQITLTANYAGLNGSGLSYQVTRDFTPNRSYDEMNTGDVDWQDHLNSALNKIDSDMGSVLSDSSKYSVDSGSLNHLVAAYTPAVTAHTNGLKLWVKAAYTNTAAVDFNPNGLGVKSVKRRDGNALKAGDIVAGREYMLSYDGTNYVLQNGEVSEGEADDYAVDSGSLNHLVGSFNLALDAHITGLPLRIKAGYTNTLAVDFNPNGLGAKSVKRRNGDALVANDIVAGRTYTLIYDGTNYVIQNAEIPDAITPNFSVDSGSTNHLVGAFAMELAAHTAGLMLRIKAANTVTGATDFNPNGLGVKTVKRRDGYDLIAGDIVTGRTYDLIYDGTNYVVQNPEGIGSSGRSVLGADYNIVNNTTWEDTGLAITLPGPGTYMIFGDVGGRGAVSATINVAIKTKLYNSTDAADVANSFLSPVKIHSTGIGYMGNAAYAMPITVTAAKTIKLYAYRELATWSLSVIDGTLSISYLSWQRIA